MRGLEGAMGGGGGVKVVGVGEVGGQGVERGEDDGGASLGGRGL